jgi:HlyD family secretion protein
MRGKWILIGGSAIFIGAGFGAWSVWLKTSPRPAEKKAPAVELPAGAEIQIPGRITARNVLPIPAPVDGVLDQVVVQPGDEVFEGQILAYVQNDALMQNERETQIELDRATGRLNALEGALIAARLEESRLSAELARAKSEHQRTERIYKRQQLLYQEGATARRAFDAASSEYEEAKGSAETLEEMLRQMTARLDAMAKEIESGKKAVQEKDDAHEAAKSDLAAATVLSPADGLVVAVNRSPGQQVEKGFAKLIEIALEWTNLEIAADASPLITQRLRPGQPALVRTPELTGEGIPATVRTVEEGRVVVEFSSPSALLKPGVNALVVLRLP